MKKILLFSILMLGLFKGYSQTQITLTFTAKDSITQAPVSLDSLYVKNLDESCDTMLYGASPVLSILANWPVGINESPKGSQGSFVLKQNYPNPFQGSTTVNIYREYKGEMKMVLFDGLGTKLAEYHNVFEKGFHSFKILASGNKVLFLVVSDDKNYRSIKIVSYGQSNESSSIRYLGKSGQMEKSIAADPENTGFVFYLGNQLMFTAYATGYHENTIFDNPTTSTAYVFPLLPLSVIVVPTVTTTAVTDITQTTATSGGNVISDGGATVTARGVCWSTSSNPTITDNHTTDGSGTGTYTSYLTSLDQNTFYYVRAYATNSVGTAYGNQLTFTTLAIPVLPTVTTTPVTDIAQTTATSGGNVTSDGNATVTVRGVCWSTSPNPTTANSHTTDGSGTGTFISYLTGLTVNTLYYVRAYATNSVGTAYGNELYFTTLPPAVLPTVTTSDVIDIWDTYATSGGNVTSSGNSPVTARGVCWSTSPNPTTANNYTVDGSGTGSYISNLTGLTQGTTYHIRAYATNSIGTGYGNELTFTTLGVPTVTTAPVTNITSSTAVSGGNVTSDGGVYVGDRGVCWSTSPNPTIANSHNSEGSGLGAFVSYLTGLTGSTFYYIRAFATNSIGTAYGNQLTFTTLPPSLPTVTTTIITNVSQTTATGGGNVTSEGGAPVTARGVCWNTSSNPTTSNSHTTDGSGDGIYVSNITGLTPNSQYYVRAYATNSVGTSYGNEVTFNNTYYIGKSFGGGIIYYVDATYMHGLIAAPTDQSAGSQFGCIGTATGATGWVIGTGQANTTAIVNACSATNCAARICDDLVLNGYSDWYLPSGGEVQQMCANYQLLGISTYEYWTSTEWDANNAYLYWISNYYYEHNLKTYVHSVRAIRAF